MSRTISIESIYQLVTDGQGATTPRSIAYRLGRDEMDPEVHAMIKSMIVSGYLRKSPLGALKAGPTQIPVPQQRRPTPGLPPPARPAPGGDVDHSRPGPSAEIPDSVLRAADAQQAAADRRLADRLAESQRQGNFVTHDMQDCCELGVWHEGLCSPPRPGQFLKAWDGAVITADREPNGYAANCSVCGYVSSDDEASWVVNQASHHYGWHNAEHAREARRCGVALTPEEAESADERERALYDRWSRMWPAPGGNGWIDWTDEPRVLPDPEGYRVLNRDGSTRAIIRPAVDGTPDWVTSRGGQKYPSRSASAHEALLAAVDGCPDPAAFRRPPPVGVPKGVEMPQQQARPVADLDPSWLTGVENEDDLVKLGKCPYQTQVGGWGSPQEYCGGERSPNEDDHPYCGPHADEIRHDRGYGGPLR